MDDLWTWSNTDTTGYDVHAYLAMDKCVNLERELWFELGKCMRRNHGSIYLDHLKYIHNYIVKPFRLKIIFQSERIR